jgi:hypothetical protein
VPLDDPAPLGAGSRAARYGHRGRTRGRELHLPRDAGAVYVWRPSSAGMAPYRAFLGLSATDSSGSFGSTSPIANGEPAVPSTFLGESNPGAGQATSAGLRTSFPDSQISRALSLSADAQSTITHSRWPPGRGRNQNADGRTHRVIPRPGPAGGTGRGFAVPNR